MDTNNHKIQGSRCLVIAAMMMLIPGCRDNVEVPPGGGSMHGIDYVSVRDEPQHRHEFENERVRIYDVLLPPGYVTLYHAHIQDTIYLVVQGSTLKTKAVVGTSIPIALPLPSGMLMWNEHAKGASIHQVTNTGDNSARLMGVELKHEAAAFKRNAIVAKGLSLANTYSKVRVYKLKLAPGEGSGKIGPGFAGLMIALSEATATVRSANASQRIASFEPASWQWLDESDDLSITNIGLSTYEAVLYELP